MLRGRGKKMEGGGGGKGESELRRKERRPGRETNGAVRESGRAGGGREAACERQEKLGTREVCGADGEAEDGGEEGGAAAANLVAGALFIHLDEHRHHAVLDDTGLVGVKRRREVPNTARDCHHRILLLRPELQLCRLALLAFSLVLPLPPLE